MALFTSIDAMGKLQTGFWRQLYIVHMLQQQRVSVIRNCLRYRATEQSLFVVQVQMERLIFLGTMEEIGLMKSHSLRQGKMLAQ